MARWSKLFLILGLVVGCVQDDETEVTIRYTVYVTDMSEIPLDSVRVKVFTEDLDSFSVLTGSSGSVVLNAGESQVNQFSLSRKGYKSIDSVDVVVLPSDSGDVPETMLRVMRFRMDTIPDRE